MFQVYKKFLIFLGITVLFCIVGSVVWSKSQINLVEIKLLNNLDDKRGFCIDIKGHKSSAKIDKGLQTHTCYSYQGKISVDQGLDADRLRQKELFFPYFDVCVNTTSYDNPINLNLIECKNTQQFIFNKDNTISLKDNKNLCLTVAKEKSRKGGGGSPLHLMRNLSMQICDKKYSIYQTWGIRHFKKGKVFAKNISNF